MSSANLNEGSTNPTSEGDPQPSTSKDSEESDSKNFECNICLDTAKDAVISMCGHLFCWPCLHQWLETRPNQQICPVCKAAVSREKVIPLYGRGSSSQQDPREKKAPPRPQARRTEPEQRNPFGFTTMGGEGGFQMSFGIGAFPFGFLTSFNLGGNQPHGSGFQMQVEEERFLSNLFLYVAILFIAWLVFA